MKTLKLFAAMTVMCTGLQAQFTGITTYQHTQPVQLTDGITTTFCQGFITAGVLPIGAGSSIYIDKVGPDGTLNGTSCGEFSNEYRFAADMIKPCGGNIVTATKCYGVSITELTYNAGAPQWYAITAAFDRGCIFAVLDMNGNIIPTPNAYYTFPVGTIKVTKPLITQSLFMPGWFYITGSYEVNGVPHMYVMKVDINGNFGGGWTRDYVVSIGAKELVPSDIIESPYPSASGTKEVIVVGTVYDITGLNHEGFFFPIDIGTGIGNPMLIYGDGSGSEEHFNGINIANSGAAGPPGYIIGGYSDYNPGAGTSWMLKIDPFGNIEWSSVIPASSGTQGEVVAVTERFSNTYGQFEYYGAATENNGMTVFKLEEFGGMFTASPNNEFIYNDFTGLQGTPVAITYNNIAGDINEGIHVYGTSNNTPSDYMLAQAYFNGASGFNCNVKLNTIANNPGPTKVGARKMTVAKGPPQCQNFFFGNAPTPVNVNAPCTVFGFSAPYPFDNSKSAGATGIKANAASDKFSVSPNPVTDKLSISYSSKTGANVSIGLYNNLGQLVTPMVTPKALQGTNTLELDLNTLNINSGVYFVTVTTDGASTTKKIIYTK